jgi:DNA helicase MCM8
MRLCIAYSRKFVHPKLSQGAKDALQTYYLSLREKHSGDGAPITTRQLEALIRLSQARARCEFRDAVTKKDAEDVICLMQASLSDIHTVDDSGKTDFGRGGASGLSMGKSVKALLRVLQARNRTGMDYISRAEIKELAKSIKINDPLQIDLVIQQLNEHGHILIAPGGNYQISSLI